MDNGIQGYRDSLKQGDTGIHGCTGKEVQGYRDMPG